MPISLTLTPFDHFHFRPPLGLLSSQDLTACHMLFQHGIIFKAFIAMGTLVSNCHGMWQKVCWGDIKMASSTSTGFHKLCVNTVLQLCVLFIEIPLLQIKLFAVPIKTSEEGFCLFQS